MFLSPLFLVGLGALAVPIFVHLLHSTKAQTIRFSTIRFLKNCQRRAARRTRLKQLVLMALRMLLLALIILGLSKPVIHQDKRSIVGGNVATAMILIIDNSYSMGFREQGVTRFDQAKDAAKNLLDSLKKGDEAAVFVVNDKVERFIKEFRPDIDEVKAKIDLIKLSSHGTEIAPALSEAYNLVHGSEKSRKEIHLLTDLQQNSLEKLLQRNFIKNEKEPRPRLYISSFGKPKTQNAYIRSVSVTGSTGAGSGIGSKILAEVESVGAGSPDNVIVLSINGEKKEQVAFTVRPGSPAQVPIEVEFDKPGTFRCGLTLNEDGLRIDDSFEFNLSVDDRVTVLVVDGDPSGVPALSEAFYLGAALNPSVYTGFRAGSEIEPTTISADQLAATSLDPYRCVILCNVSGLNGDQLVKMESFLNTGGSVIIFAGDKMNVAACNKWSFMPATLKGIEGGVDRKDFVGLGRISPSHPIFAGMADLRTTKVFRYIDCDGEKLPEGSQVIASLMTRNAPPLIVERAYGRGRVMLFTITADLAWSNLPLRRNFVPLVHRTVTYMSGRKATAQAYHVGDAIEFRALAKHYDKSIKVTPPVGAGITLRPQIEGSYAIAKFTNTSEPGRYVVQTHKDFTNSSGFSVNPDVKESDLTMVPLDKLEEEFKDMNVVVLTTPGKILEKVTENREGWKLWPLLFKLGLLFFCIEILVANLFSRTVEYGGVQMPLFDYLKLRRGGGLNQ